MTYRTIRSFINKIENFHINELLGLALLNSAVCFVLSLLFLFLFLFFPLILVCCCLLLLPIWYFASLPMETFHTKKYRKWILFGIGCRRWIIHTPNSVWHWQKHYFIDVCERACVYVTPPFQNTTVGNISKCFPSTQSHTHRKRIDFFLALNNCATLENFFRAAHDIPRFHSFFVLHIFFRTIFLLFSVLSQ